MRHDIDTLTARADAEHKAQVALAARTAAIEGRLDKVDEQLDDIKQLLENVGLTARRTGANLGATVDQVHGELAGLKGDIAELHHELDTLKTTQQTFADDTAQKLAALKSKAALQAVQAKQKAAQLARPTTPGPFLALARKKLAAGDTDVAQDLLHDFLKRWPKDRHASDARLLLGRSFYDAKQWRPAILEYNKFRESYPKDKRMPGVLLNIGECFAQIDLKPEAGKFFDAVIHRYPHSHEARVARRRKKALKIR